MTMPKIHPSWWKLVLDGKLHHIEAGNTPYGSTASLRSAIYREAMERGLGAMTAVEPMHQTLFVQAWNRHHDPCPRPLLARAEESTPAPDSFAFRVPPVLARQQAPVAVEPEEHRRLALARAQVEAAGLNGTDPDLIEERLYCTCGLGNATEGKVHDPGCGVWS